LVCAWAPSAKNNTWSIKANRIRQAILDFRSSNLAPERFLAEPHAKERITSGDIAGCFI